MIKQTFRSYTFNPVKFMSQKYQNRYSGDLEHFDKETAKIIAKEVLKWAKSHDVTSFTFWIHPQTSQNIEKHDSIYDLEYFFRGIENFELVERFTAMVLMKGEGDGSSFPNGGMRGTDKARAYIAWEARSDMFIRKTKNGNILYIPGMLLTHHGEALDQKTYLLRAQKQLKDSHNQVKHVMLALGLQQQFFIIPKKDYESRIDLKECGRALYGRLPPKNQQFADHYYGRIDSKILEILNQAEQELLKMGVPVKTKHKQVAVNQYQMSCSFQNALTAIDHNMLMIDVLREVFDHHGYTVLLHEKPFAHANGSAKHCNWSILVNNGEALKNLYEPGVDPRNNKQFILFILMTLKAVLSNAGLLIASVTSPSNEHRMGGHEAPPCIISVFLGSFVDRLLNSIEKGEEFHNEIKDLEKVIPGLVSFLQDNTDRNRTSPFAFTGNKFQFRSVGSKQNPTFSMTVIACIMTKEMREVTAELEKGIDIDTIIQSLIKETKKIRFQGNGYTKEWETQAATRDIPNFKKALHAYEAVKNAEILKKVGVFSDKELQAKYNILMNNYVLIKEVEARTLEIIIKQNFLPRLLTQLKTLSTLGKESLVNKLQTSKFQKMYIQLSKSAQQLKTFLNQISQASEIQVQVTIATDLRQYIYNLSHTISDIEIELPTDKNIPQLFQFLNVYK